MSTDGLFTSYERLQTVHRVEVTLENLHILAQHFGGEAIYTIDPEGDWQTKKPRLFIPERAGGTPGTIEVGAWVDPRGQRWNPEPINQGYFPAGTYTKVEGL